MTVISYFCIVFVEHLYKSANAILNKSMEENISKKITPETDGVIIENGASLNNNGKSVYNTSYGCK